MKLEIITPEKVIYSGEASLVQLPGVDGSFEILKDHAPLIAALSAGNIKYKSPTQTVSLKISGGFAESLNNSVNVMVEGVTEN
ncbi:MAG: ATP synthase F1 subunit epsilon [Bacteroidetes bacterium 37-13]|nr:MAG: ATP synthase F1 subunit epsilon [Bacteroidetes bacterium 37-13]